MIMVGNNWRPPQLANLVGAWVAGLSGPVAIGGTWNGQYGTGLNATLFDSNYPIRDNAYVELSGGMRTDGYGADRALAAAPLWQVGTVAFWLRRAGDQTALVSQPLTREKSGVYDFDFNFSNASSMYNRFVDGTGAAKDYSVATQDGVWIHLAASIGATAMQFYVNGVAVGAAKPMAGGGLRSTDAAKLSLGTSEHSGFYGPINGHIDNIYVWADVALSDPEVAEVYARDPYRRGNR